MSLLFSFFVITFVSLASVSAIPVTEIIVDTVSLEIISVVQKEVPNTYVIQTPLSSSAAVPTPKPIGDTLIVDYRDRRGKLSTTYKYCPIEEITIRAEVPANEDGKLKGTNIDHNITTCSFALEGGALDIRLHHNNRTRRYHNQEFHALQTGVDITLTTLQYVGDTTSQINFIFLSAGYQSNSQFLNNVNKALHLLQYPTMPNIVLSRYFPIFNVFAVYEHSAETGASKPIQRILRQNNLQCGFGFVESRLSCDATLSVALASRAPPQPGTPNTIIVVLVNEGQYGGAAAYSYSTKITYFYNGALELGNDEQKMASLLYHELGHATGDLIDEYDYGMQEYRKVRTNNCHWQNTDMPWMGWVKKGKADQIPSSPCGYTNYFKSTTSCIMEKLRNPAPCAVCAEATVQHLYNNGMGHFAPLCPHRYEILYVSTGVADNNVTFYVNHRLATTSAIGVSWYVNDIAVVGEVSSSFTFVALKHARQGTGVYRVLANITDQTDMVLPENKLDTFSQLQTWVVNVISPDDFNTLFSANNKYNATVARQQCPSEMSAMLYFRPGVSISYVSSCTAGKNCSREVFTSHPYDSNNDDLDVEEVFDRYVLNVTGAVVAVSVLIFIIAAVLYGRRVAKRPNHIVLSQITVPMRIARIGVFVTATITLSAAVCAFILTLLIYSAFGMFVVNPAIVAVSFALFGVVLCVLGYVAWYYMLRRFLILHSIMLILCIAGLLAATVICLNYADSLERHDSVAITNLQDRWIDAATNDPSRVCYLQKYLKCSGFEIGCPRVSLSTQCPQGCDSVNRFNDNRCLEPLVDLTVHWYRIAGWVIFGLDILCILAICSSMWLFFQVHKFIHQIHRIGEHMKWSLIRSIQNLSQQEYDNLVAQIPNPDQCNAKEVEDFFLFTFGFEPSSSDIRSAFFLVGANNGSGKQRTQLSLRDYIEKVRVLTFDPTFDMNNKMYSEAREVWVSLAEESRTEMMKMFGTISSATSITVGASTAPDDDQKTHLIKKEAFVEYHKTRFPGLPQLYIEEMFHECDVAQDNEIPWTPFLARYHEAICEVMKIAVWCYYRKYNTERLATVPETCEKYKQELPEMWHNLQQKYGEFPTTYLCFDSSQHSYQEGKANWRLLNQATRLEYLATFYDVCGETNDSMDSTRFMEHYRKVLDYLPMQALDDMFKAFDVDGDGSLTWTEFVARHSGCFAAVQHEYLKKFYQHYNPEKVANVDTTLAKWRGHEALMWEELIDKYGAFPTDQIGSHTLTLDPDSDAFEVANKTWLDMGSQQRIETINAYQEIRTGGSQRFLVLHTKTRPHLSETAVRGVFDACDVNHDGDLSW
eukprot:PhF_6_TR26701/c0_g1_i5/m.38993